MKYFGLVGAAGYIAPRHLRAISETGGELILSYDKNDSVGILDSYFPETAFFTEFEMFDRHFSKLLRQGRRVDYLTVCTPNYLHDAHIRYGLRMGTDVICEKPLVLNPWNVDALAESERETGRRIYTILQLRLHPAIAAMKRMVDATPADHTFDIDLTYITSRGKWYYASWKGDESKSGGVATNIGVHFFDMLQWVFGEVGRNVVNVRSHDRVAGVMELRRARVRYFLSINAEHLPEESVAAGRRTCRRLTIDGEEVDFTIGFENLHTESYRRILSGEGFGVADARAAVEMVYDIRHITPVGLTGDYHPAAAYPLRTHPFGWK